MCFYIYDTGMCVDDKINYKWRFSEIARPDLLCLASSQTILCEIDHINTWSNKKIVVILDGGKRYEKNWKLMASKAIHHLLNNADFHTHRNMEIYSFARAPWMRKQPCKKLRGRRKLSALISIVCYIWKNLRKVSSRSGKISLWFMSSRDF